MHITLKPVSTAFVRPSPRLVVYTQHAELSASKDWLHQATRTTGLVNIETDWWQ